MELKSLFCPNCGASLTIEDGLDKYFCQYCGKEILLQGQSKAAYDAKVRVKNMEHKEKLQEQRNAQERYRIEADQKETRRILLFCGGLLGAVLAMSLIFTAVGNIKEKRQERELQAVVDEIMIDIENEDFADAYVKANSLYWDSGSSENKEKWNSTREEIIKQIEAAEEKASETTENSSEENNKEETDEKSGWFWDWFK